MMIRRVLCLLLAAQLLLVQGLLSRACVGQCGQAAHSGRPHVHARQLCSTLATQERPRCPCCQRKLEHSVQKVRSVESARDKTHGADADDAIYLPGQLMTAGDGQKQTWADERAAVAVTPSLFPDVVRQESPPSAAVLPASRPPGLPVYLLTLRLLV